MAVEWVAETRLPFRNHKIGESVQSRSRMLPGCVWTLCVFGTWCGAYAAETISSLNITFWFLLVFVCCFRDLFFGENAKEVRLTMRTQQDKQAITIVNIAELMTAQRWFAANANEPSEYFICQKYWFYYCLAAIIVNEPKTKTNEQDKVFVWLIFDTRVEHCVWTTTNCYVCWMSMLFSTDWERVSDSEWDEFDMYRLCFFRHSSLGTQSSGTWFYLADDCCHSSLFSFSLFWLRAFWENDAISDDCAFRLHTNNKPVNKAWLMNNFAHFRCGISPRVLH